MKKVLRFDGGLIKFKSFKEHWNELHSKDFASREPILGWKTHYVSTSQYLKPFCVSIKFNRVKFCLFSSSFETFLILSTAFKESYLHSNTQKTHFFQPLLTQIKSWTETRYEYTLEELKANCKDDSNLCALSSSIE